MNVFKIIITMSVIGLTAARSIPADALWRYQVDPPAKPTLVTTKQLTNPTLGQIQAAIAPKTRINIFGTVNASGGGKLSINADDVRLNFERANVINWSGGDTWNGFLEIGGNRVEVERLRMQVAGSGRCRGVVIHSPASDVRISNCEFSNIADGLIADGNWSRLVIERTKFLNCGDWGSSNNMEGGYGMFLEDDDGERDDLRLSNVTITLAPSSGQHGIRIAKVQRALIEGSHVTANAKRSLWAYGVDRLAVRTSTFRIGSLLFNLRPDESQTSRYTRRVRIDSCRIEHSSILDPISIYCGKGTANFQMRDLDVFSTTADRWLAIGWRSDDRSHSIRWHDGTVTFNGQVQHGWSHAAVNDWNNQECQELSIGPMNAS